MREGRIAHTGKLRDDKDEDSQCEGHDTTITPHSLAQPLVRVDDRAIQVDEGEEYELRQHIPGVGRAHDQPSLPLPAENGKQEAKRHGKQEDAAPMALAPVCQPLYEASATRP